MVTGTGTGTGTVQSGGTTLPEIFESVDLLLQAW